jgi:hypothetical protein
LLNYKCKFCNFQRIFESVMIFTSQCNFGVLQGVRENFERGLVPVVFYGPVRRPGDSRINPKTNMYSTL